MLTLRPYQIDALSALEDYLREAKGTSPIICAPTGSGKGLLIAELIRRVCTSKKDAKIICCTHSRELVAQNSAELKSLWKEADIGIYSAGLNKRQTRPAVVFCGIQSVYKKAFSFGHVDLIIIDEAHAISRNAQSMYGKFLSDVHISSPNVILVGMTATPYKLSEGMLHVGDDRIFDGIAYVCELKRLINEGYLVPVISKGGVQKIDMSTVHVRAGDWANNELAHAADDPELVRLAVAEIVAYGANRKAWLLFCSGVVHAEHVANEVRKHGIEAAVVTGETPKAERDETVKRFKDGKLRCLVNVAVFTTGFNAPICDLIALLMATKSTGKYVQVLGRGTRLYPGKQDCLVLDYGNNILGHGCLDDIDPIRTRNVFNVVKNAEPVKECPNCHAIIHTRIMQCPACDFIFQATAAHGVEAYSGAVLKSQQEPFFVSVVDTWYSRHKKIGSPDILKIAMYDSADTEFPIWCCLGHDGYAREKAVAVVKQFGGHTDNVTDSLKESVYWKKPKTIKVIPNGKFYNVVGIEFNPAEPRQVTFGDTSE